MPSMMLPLVLSLLWASQSMQQAPPASSCLSLANSKTCDLFSKNVVNLDALRAEEGLRFDNVLKTVNDIASFDSWITRSAFQVTGFLYKGFLNNCTGINPENDPLRYATSILCGRAVLIASTPKRGATDTSSFCPANIASPPPALCAPICDDFATSFLAVLRGPKCGFNATQTRPTAKDLQQLCENFLTVDQVTPCTKASSEDATTCGFGKFNLDDAETYCAQSKSSPCCADLVSASKPTVTSTAPTSITSAPVSTQTSSSDAAPSGSVLTPAVAGALSAVILAAIATGALFIYSYYRKKQKAEQAMVAAHAKARMERLEEAVLGQPTSTSSETGRTGGVSSLSSETRINSVAATRSTPGATPQPQAVSSPPQPTSASQYSYSQDGSKLGVGPTIPSGLSAAPSTDLTPDSTFSALWRVVTAYEPQMEDEVLLQHGDYVILETIYNDGWARGTNQGNRMFGYLPMACLEPIDSEPIPIHDREADLAIAAVSAANTNFAHEVRNSINSQTLRNLTMTNLSRYEAGNTLSTYNGIGGGSFILPSSSGGGASGQTSQGYPANMQPMRMPPQAFSTLSGAETLSLTALDSGSVDPATSNVQGYNSNALYEGLGAMNQGVASMNPPVPSGGIGMGGPSGSPYTGPNPTPGGMSTHSAKNSMNMAPSSSPSVIPNNPFERLMQPPSTQSDTESGVAGSVTSGSDRSRPVLSALGSLARSNDDSTLDR
ncbi:hypothetical protein HDU97_009093 [Phlyctochytrium planicorne]|nr:hypothetical protein HDU97_009093 [Phlyctochytrium planicorne]